MDILYRIVILVLMLALGLSFYYIYNLKKSFKSMLETEDKFYHTNNQELMEKLNEQNLSIEEYKYKNEHLINDKLNLIWGFSDFISEISKVSISPQENSNPNIVDIVNIDNLETIKNISKLIPILSSFKSGKISSKKYTMILEELRLDGMVNIEMEVDDMIQLVKNILVTDDILYSIEKLNEYLELKVGEI